MSNENHVKRGENASVWAVCSLSDVLKYCPRPEKVQENTKYNLIGVRWYANGAHLHDSKLGRELQSKTVYRVKYGDVIYNRMWPTKGAFSVIDSDFGDAVATNEYPTFVPSPMLDIQYLKFVMKTEKFWTAASSFAKGTTGRARLHQDDFLKLTIAIPPLTEQLKIAAILTSIDATIAATQRIIEQTEVVKRGLMQKLLTKGIGHTSFKQTEIGEIPTEWVVTTLGELGQLKSGSTPSRSKEEVYYVNGTIPWVKTLDLNNSVITSTQERVTEQALKDTSCTVIPRGSVLVAMYGGYNQIGRTGLLGIDATINQALTAVIFEDQETIYPQYVLHWLNHRVGFWKMFAASSRKDPNITKGDVQRFPIALPPFGEQVKISEIISAVEGNLQVERGKLQQLNDVKHGLMQVLLTGKVRVQVDQPSEVPV